MNQPIKIGTRGSKLALWQAYHIQDLLKAFNLESEIITMETKGDKILDRSLSKIGSKGVFTEELEDALRNGTMDIAVHSAKDMQSTIPDDLELIAFTEREKETDVVISVNGKVDLSKDGIRIATSSTRRRALVRKYFPNAELVDVRGNLQTRIKKLEEGIADCLLLAYAGVHRMEYDNLISEELSITDFVPPVGQGSVAVQCAKSLDSELKYAIRKACNHKETEYKLKAERSFLSVLNGGCSIPVFGNAQISDNKLHLTGGILSLDGTKMLKETVSSDIPCGHFAGIELADRLVRQGALKMLEDIRNEIN